MTQQPIFDTLIIGAGLSGLCLAHQLGNKGVKCLVIDRRPAYPEAFRADKLEHNQIAALRKAGLDQFVVPSVDTPIGHIKSYRSGVVADVDTIDQYGFSYSDTVNNLRNNIPDHVEIVVAAVTSIKNSDEAQTVTTKTGESFFAKLVVIATGGNETVPKLVGMGRKRDENLRSLNFGFDVVRTDKQPFDFRGFNYHAEDPTTGVDYVTFFYIGDAMRVNIFTQWEVKDERALDMRRDPIADMKKYFANLYDYVGDVEVTGRVEVFPTNFYRVTNHIQAGIVVIADEYQSVSPATGRGLDKLTNDTALLAEHYIPMWLKAGSVKKSDVESYYKNKDKIKTDQRARGDWIFYHNDFRGKKATLVERVINRFKAKFDLI